ncbi:matrixin family metalloprotease [Fulvivirgaceae bacterium BMA10]|uniref:Matrixin family metalloprotease n=1 Tax=Splendidivirga corallicola TaxID=3051826 RepID=A0ABT8KXM0_9BACT|nr:matrixin family metalloprotease [Fulvivirgaceae bacterium BMA10]
MSNNKKSIFKVYDEHIGSVKKPEANDVIMLQKLLVRLGYLKEDSYEQGTFCKQTQKAVIKYQRFHEDELKIDGIAGPHTKELLSQPRCGLPEEDQFSSNFVLRGCSYENKNVLTYTFENDSKKFGDPHEARELVREAFAEWQKVCSLTFEEVTIWENPDFRIAWHQGDHGDGNAFDGVGRTLAHAFYPPPCGGRHSGELHFDDAEAFANRHSTSKIDLKAVAIHEIGHLLGLRHSDKKSAIMYPSYNPKQLVLGDDDIAGIQKLYGLPKLKFLAIEEGYLSNTGDEARFSLAIPAEAKIVLEGSDEADFDLYVSKGIEPSTLDFDIRAWTVSSDEVIAISPEEPATYHILVKSYSGAGSFKLAINLV